MAQALGARRQRATREEPRRAGGRAVRSSASRAVRFADADQVGQLAEEMKQALLNCHDYGHGWRPWTAAEVHDDLLGHHWERTARCTSCRATRTQVLDTYGDVIQTRYTYPDGYVNKGLGRIAGEARAALRLVNTRRHSKGGR
jgi:hypothetical protein